MPSLPERIKSEAADRLALPPGRPPSTELPRYKAYLKWQSNRLRILHRGGAGGRAICRARSLAIDLLIDSIFKPICANFVDDPRRPRPRIAVVALGGYGRGELSPFSDVDILLLHNGDSVMTHHGKPHPLLTALTSTHGLLYTLYDIGLKVGHSTRNTEDCARAANSDMQSKTAFLEARFIAGDQPLFRQLQAVILARCVRDHEQEYIQARLEDQAARRAKHGDSAFMQEPNLKNGCGGLRDYHNLLWMAYFKCRAASLAELIPFQIISASEARQLEKAYDFLLRVRNELHYHQDRVADVLTRAIQPAIALNLGYTERSTVRRIERFMRDLYLHLRHIYLTTRAAEQRLALLPVRESRIPSLRQLWNRGRQRVQQQVLDGFLILDRQLLPSAARIFRDQPRRLIRAFLHAQQRGLQFHPDLAQLIRQEVRLVDRAFLRDEHARQTFLEILNQRGNVASTLRSMHELGFLGKYIPEFGKLTALVQHEFYHQYSADEHTLVCIEKLDDIWEVRQPLYQPYAEIFHELERPFLLYLALLLHDAGKGYKTANHSHKGADLALRAARRLGLDGALAHTLRLIVENHLLMAQISQRRDLDDPLVIRNFARQVQSLEGLHLLTILTFADSLATSPRLWNGFKDSLLWTLHHKSRNTLAGGTDFIASRSRHLEQLAAEVRKLMPDHLHPDELEAHFKTLPSRYFEIHSPQEILADIALAHEFMRLQISPTGIGLEPVFSWHNEPDRGCTRVKISTWDRSRLFSKLAGAFTAAGLNILTAQIFSRSDGIILDTFFVTDARTSLLPGRDTRAQLEEILCRILTESYDPAPLIAKQSRARPLYRFPHDDRLPTVITFDNESSQDRTILDIETEDRVGLLYAISQALAACNIEISVAKICTEKGAAADTFYIHAPNGAKIQNPAQLRPIERQLRSVLAE